MRAHIFRSRLSLARMYVCININRHELLLLCRDAVFCSSRSRPGVCQLWKNDKSAFAPCCRRGKIAAATACAPVLEKGPRCRLPVSGDIHLRSEGAYAALAACRAYIHTLMPGWLALYFSSSQICILQTFFGPNCGQLFLFL